MKALLMAAGVGSRISKYIEGPKCTLLVEQKPLIRKTVEMLLKNNIDVGIVVGYESQYIKEALRGLAVTFFENPFYKVTNSMASLWFAKEFIDDTVICANADVFWEEDILEKITADNEKVVMLSDESRVDKGDYFFKVENGHVVRYGKELKRDERTSEYVGIAKIQKNAINTFLDHLDKMIHDNKYDLWWENVLYDNIQEQPISVNDISECFWAEIDYIEDYNRIQEYLKHGDISIKNQ